MTFKINQIIDLGKWGNGQISKIYKSKNGQIMGVGFIVKNEMFGIEVEERAAPFEVNWNGQKWAITKNAIKERLNPNNR